MPVQRRWLRRGPLGPPCHSADRHRSAPGTSRPKPLTPGCPQPARVPGGLRAAVPADLQTSSTSGAHDRPWPPSCAPNRTIWARPVPRSSSIEPANTRLVFGRNGQRTRSPRVMPVQRRWLRRGPLGSPCHSADRHRSAPDDTLLAHAGVSNKEPNAPLESRTRALAKLRYSPWRNESSLRRRSGHTARPGSARRRRRRSWRSAARVRPSSTRRMIPGDAGVSGHEEARVSMIRLWTRTSRPSLLHCT